MTTENKWFAMDRKTDAEGNQSAEAEISIYDSIGGFGVSANEFIDELKGLGDVETINLRIASGGGSIVEGNTIFNALKRHSAKVVTHVDSLAASMASVIAMAGDEIHMAANALLMIHNPWTMSMGGAEQLRKDADLLDKMEANIRTSYGRSNLSAEELDAAMDAETYFTAEEALEKGFIDVISDANLAAASIGDMETLKAFNAIPQAKIDGIKIECQARQLEASNAQVEKLQGDIELHEEQVALIQNEVIESKAEVEALKVEHVEALEAANEQTAQAIADKAAEVLAESGTPAIEDIIEEVAPVAMNEEGFWKEYNALKESRDFQGASEFYAEHKSVVGQ
jgi:ATP-dependent protease ClpP protease subunit